MPQHRVVSLIASATEIVCALGCEEQLVGRSHECDFPPSVERVPACSRPRIDVSTGSRQIDQAVKNVLEQALSVYEVDVALLDELRPTVIVTQTQCEVCAVSLKDVEQAVCRLVGSQPKIVSLEPNGLADVWTDFRRVGAALDVQQRAEALIDRMQSRFSKLHEQTSHEQKRPTLACIEWIDPLMAAGNWVPDLVDIAGGRNLLGDAGRHSSYMSFDELARSNPDVIAVMPCGFDIERTRIEMPALTGRTGWGELRAVNDGRVYLTDGNQYFNRPGPRLVESAEIFAEMLHPGRFNFGHHGRGWLPYDETRL